MKSTSIYTIDSSDSQQSTRSFSFWIDRHDRPSASMTNYKFPSRIFRSPKDVENIFAIMNHFRDSKDSLYSNR